MCFGPSNAEQAASGAESNFANLLRSEGAQRFGEQSAIQQNLTNLYTPLAESPNPQGFSPEQLATLNTKAIDASGAANRNATQAVQNGRAQAGGEGLTSGVTSAIEGNVAATEAGDLANNQLNIANENATLGVQRQDQARTALGQIALGESPSSFDSSAVSAGADAFSAANTVSQQQNAASEGIIKGVTGLATSALGGFANLDNTGSSTSGEQLQNFAGGFSS